MIINGKEIQKQILDQVAEEVKLLPFQPIFTDVLIGENSVSAQYVRMKAKMAESLGLAFKHANISEEATLEEILDTIHTLNTTEHMCGLIVQLPVPKKFDQQKILNAVLPVIDVDATGEENAKLFYEGKARFIFPTAKAVITILDTLGLNLTKEKILVVGQGQLVGKPVSYLLRARGLSIDTADANTKNTPELIATASVIISAVGKGKLITGDMVSDGVVLIDAGTSEQSGAIVGDIDFESVNAKARFVSPVPGGVGPVTVAELFRNVLLSSKHRAGISNSK